MPDEIGFGLIVYDWKANKSWRLEHSFFYPDPLAGDYKIAGLNFQWPGEGVFGVALSPIDDDGYRTLFFHPLSSNREFSVSTKYLRNEALSNTSYHKFQVQKCTFQKEGPRFIQNNLWCWPFFAGTSWAIHGTFNIGGYGREWSHAVQSDWPKCHRLLELVTALQPSQSRGNSSTQWCVDIPSRY